MKREIVTHNAVEGFHAWPDAIPEVAYLRDRHRHIFVIRTWFIVTDNDREIEINLQGAEIRDYLRKKYGEPCEFGAMSCESIAEDILGAFARASRCEVLEDGYAGAALSK